MIDYYTEYAWVFCSAWAVLVGGAVAVAINPPIRSDTVLRATILSIIVACVLRVLCTALRAQGQIHKANETAGWASIGEMISVILVLVELNRRRRNRLRTPPV